VLAVRGERQVAVMVWHYHDDDVAGPDARIDLAVMGLKGRSARVSHWRIDEQHSNAYAAWKRMGSPIAPDRAGYESLRAAGRLALLEDPADVRVAGGKSQLAFTLPRQAVSLLVIEPR
jgi:xylan 1,4-beta-xylosidase